MTVFKQDFFSQVLDYPEVLVECLGQEIRRGHDRGRTARLPHAPRTHRVLASNPSGKQSTVTCIFLSSLSNLLRLICNLNLAAGFLSKNLSFNVKQVCTMQRNAEIRMSEIQIRHSSAPKSKGVPISDRTKWFVCQTVRIWNI